MIQKTEWLFVKLTLNDNKKTAQIDELLTHLPEAFGDFSEMLG